MAVEVGERRTGRIGEPIKRVEDPRLFTGAARYLDDLKLTGVAYVSILRSPYAHARIRSIDVAAARAHPQVEAVLTGADLAERGLAWMPTRPTPPSPGPRSGSASGS